MGKRLKTIIDGDKKTNQKRGNSTALIQRGREETAEDDAETAPDETHAQPSPRSVGFDPEKMMAVGMSERQIADTMGFSATTARRVMHHIRQVRGGAAPEPRSWRE